MNAVQLADCEEISDEWDNLCFSLKKSLIQPLTSIIYVHSRRIQSDQGSVFDQRLRCDHLNHGTGVLLGHGLTGCWPGGLRVEHVVATSPRGRKGRCGLTSHQRECP